MNEKKKSTRKIFNLKTFRFWWINDRNDIDEMVNWWSRDRRLWTEEWCKAQNKFHTTTKRLNFDHYLIFMKIWSAWGSCFWIFWDFSWRIRTCVYLFNRGINWILFSRKQNKWIYLHQTKSIILNILFIYRVDSLIFVNGRLVDWSEYWSPCGQHIRNLYELTLWIVRSTFDQFQIWIKRNHRFEKVESRSGIPQLSPKCCWKFYLFSTRGGDHPVSRIFRTDFFFFSSIYDFCFCLFCYPA